MWKFQKKVVYSVLDELFPNKEYKNKIVEIFNKIDLITDFESIKQEIKLIEYPVIPISAKENINIDNLLKVIKNQLNSYFNKTETVIKVKFEEYDKILNWLKQ